MSIKNKVYLQTPYFAVVGNGRCYELQVRRWVDTTQGYAHFTISSHDYLFVARFRCRSLALAIRKTV